MLIQRAHIDKTSVYVITNKRINFWKERRVLYSAFFLCVKKDFFNKKVQKHTDKCAYIHKIYKILMHNQRPNYKGIYGYIKILCKFYLSKTKKEIAKKYKKIAKMLLFFFK